MVMRAGTLRDRVRIEVRSGQERSAVGQATPLFTFQEDRFADVEDLSGRMLINAQAAGSRLKTKVTFRDSLDFTIAPLTHRIVFVRRGATRTLNIEAVIRDGANESVECMCTEKDAA